MKYLGALLLIVLVFTIIVGGTYNQQEVVDISIQLVPTPTAQPGLVESSLREFAGIVDVHHSKDNNLLEVSYDKARLSVADINHLISTLGYESVPVEEVRSSL
ncbi:MAG: hypothetical protein V3W14_10855 [Candidatus Neomarinimicrobiota bacterium]